MHFGVNIVYMIQEVYEAMNRALAQGVAPQDVGKLLISQGWSADLVKQATDAQLTPTSNSNTHGSFKKWLSIYQKLAIGPLIIVVLLSTIGSLIMLLRPWPIKIMVDSAFGEIPAPWILEPYTHTSELILITSVMTVVIYFTSSVTNMFKDYLQARFGLKLNQALKERLFLHILNIPTGKGQLTKGDYIYRQNSLTNSLSDYLINSRAGLLQAVFMIISIIVIMLMINAKLTLITAALIPAIFILTKVLSPRVTAFSRFIAQNTSSAASVVNESIDNTETIQSFDMASKQLSKAQSFWSNNYLLMLKSLVAGRTYRLSNSLSVIIATSAVMYFGGVAALNGDLTLGELLIFITYMNYLQGPVQNIVNQINTRSQKRMDLMRIYEVVAEYEDIENAWEGNHFPSYEGAITLSDLSYQYGDTVVFNNINLSIPAKQKVGIIGPSGSGKSTLLKLLMLFNEPTNGKITVDDIDIKSIALQEYRHEIASVSQNPQLFNATISDNIIDGAGHQTLTQQDFNTIIEATGVAKMVKLLPSQLETLVGENGSNLSGGQRQKVSLARALAKKAPILFLDEPTSSLDSESENSIKDALPSLIQDKTVVLVSHRKALLTLMDAVYVLENGQLHNIDELGGLDAYLTKINDADNELAVRQAKLEEMRLAQQLQREKELQQKEIELQEKVDSRPIDSSSNDEVSVIINH